MNKLLIYAGIYVFSVFISSISQILLKKSALKHYNSRLKEYLNFPVITAYAIFFISSLLTTLAFKYVPLSMGPIIESLGYIFIGVLSYFFLGEKLSRRKLVGMAVILGGIIITSL